MTRRSQGRSRRNTGPRRTSRSARPPSLPHAILRPLSFPLGSWHRRPEEICNALSAPFEISRGFARPVGSRPADTPQFAPPARWQVREGRTDVSEQKNIGLLRRGAANPERAWPERGRPVAGGNACPVIANPLLNRARGVPISRFPQDSRKHDKRDRIASETADHAPAMTTASSSVPGFGVRGSFVAASSARSENRSSSGSFGSLRQQSRAMRRLRRSRVRDALRRGGPFFRPRIRISRRIARHRRGVARPVVLHAEMRRIRNRQRRRRQGVRKDDLRRRQQPGGSALPGDGELCLLTPLRLQDVMLAAVRNLRARES